MVVASWWGLRRREEVGETHQLFHPGEFWALGTPRYHQRNDHRPAATENKYVLMLLLLA